MLSHRDGSPRVAAWVVVLLLLTWQVSPARTIDPEDTSSTIVGKITIGGGKKAVEGATVLAYHLSTAQLFRSAPTSSKGKFEIHGLQYGYYDLAIETPDGLFVGNEVVNAPPGGKVVANMSLVPSAAGEEQREFPGTEQPTKGIANSVKGGMSKKGKIALWTTGGAVAMFLILDDDDDKSSSPSTPSGSR